MTLSAKQKEYIRKKYKKVSINEISKRIKVDKILIREYLDKIQNKKKKDVKKEIVIVKTIDKNLKLKIKNFSFKRFWRKNKWQVIGILIMAMLVFANSLDNEFVSDDVAGLLNNNKLSNFSNIFTGLSFIQNFLYFLIVNVFGKSAFWFRLINNYLPHMLMVFGVYVFSYLLFDEKTAFFTSILMSIHPILAESVVWISAGVYVRYSMLMVWGLNFYILSLKNKKYFWIGLSILILSMLSAEKGVVFPAFLLILWLSFGIVYKDWKKVLSYTLLPVVVLIVIYLSKLQGRLSILRTDYYNHGGMTNPFLQIPVAISSYFGLIFWPDRLTLYHSELNFGYVQFGFIILGFLIYLGLMVWGFFKNRIVFFGLAWFLIALSPTLTPFGVSWVVAERYAYLACVGIFLILGVGMSRLADNRKYQSAAYLLFSLLIIGMIVRTVVRNNDWQNQDNLWIAAARTSPNSQQNQNNLGDLYGRRGDYEKAIYHFKKAIALNPNYGDAWHNLGNIYTEIGMTEDAIGAYETVLQINPNVWQTYQNLGAIYYNLGERDKALEYLEKALTMNPDHEGLKRTVMGLRMNVE